MAASPVLANASCHFALLDTSAGQNAHFPELDQFTNTILLRMPEPMSPDKAIVLGLRLLRGTIREEDVVIAVDPRHIPKKQWLPAVLHPLVEEGYDSKKLVLLNSSWLEQVWHSRSTSPIAGFRGWFAQFQLKRAEFNQGFRSGLEATTLPKRWIRLPQAAFTTWMESAFTLLAKIATAGTRHTSLPLFVLGWGAVILYLVITPSHAAFWTWLN